MDPSPRPVNRHPKQTLHHAWAPKLGRTVQFTGFEQLHLWVMLEAHPGVSLYCERPVISDGEESPAADFWVRLEGQAIWITLEIGKATAINRAPAVADDVLIVSAQEVDRHRVWIQNWLALLPYLSTASLLRLDSLRAPVLDAFQSEASFDEVEQRLSRFDPVLVRSAVIDGLHQGLLFSNDLMVRPWDRHTRVAQVHRPKRHAPN